MSNPELIPESIQPAWLISYREANLLPSVAPTRELAEQALIRNAAYGPRMDPCCVVIFGDGHVEVLLP